MDTDDFRFLCRTQPKEKERVLEIGSSYGASTEQLALAVGDEGRVIGTDISAECVEKTSQANEHKHVTFQKMDALIHFMAMRELIKELKPNVLTIDVGGDRALD